MITSSQNRIYLFKGQMGTSRSTPSESESPALFQNDAAAEDCPAWPPIWQALGLDFPLSGAYAASAFLEYGQRDSARLEL